MPVVVKLQSDLAGFTDTTSNAGTLAEEAGVSLVVICADAETTKMRRTAQKDDVLLAGIGEGLACLAIEQPFLSKVPPETCSLGMGALGAAVILVVTSEFNYGF